MLKPYRERAADAVVDSTVAVMIMLAEDYSDMEFWRVKPQVPESSLIGPEEFAARKLRGVGLIALHGLTPVYVLKEPLPPDVVTAIGMAFAAYIEEHTEHGRAMVEIEELHRLWSLPDSRHSGHA